MSEYYACKRQRDIKGNADSIHLCNSRSLGIYASVYFDVAFLVLPFMNFTCDATVVLISLNKTC